LSSRSVTLGLCLGLSLGLASVGCEQNSPEWFPHMKKQPAIQAFEELSDLDGNLLVPDHGPGPLSPPEGSVPVGGSDPQIGRMDVAAADALKNPTDPTDFHSVERGAELYGVYCRVCHGDTGLGNGPVSATGGGPFGGVFPLVGLVTGRSDGYIWNVIRLGGGGTPGLRMPSYQRIPSEDRWHIVNYVRYLDRKGGRP
jgi:mono/diheme cytochrome c family protein